MAQFNYTVDTTPMAASIDTVSQHVVATTAAVTAMEAAVIKTEREAAEKISQEVDHGFYNMIRSNVSMKLASNFTDMNSKLGLMLEFSKALSQATTRMESDFNRLKREYFKIFHGLDKALENRIAQLDQDAMKIAGVRKSIISGRALRDIPSTKFAISEIPATEQLAISARLKSKTSRALGALGKKVHESESYITQLDHMMDPRAITGQFNEYLPIVYVNEQSTVMSESYVTQIVCPEYLSESAKNTISMAVYGKIDALMNVPKDPAEQQEVAKEFENMVATSQMDSRTAQVMIQLFQNGGR